MTTNEHMKAFNKGPHFYAMKTEQERVQELRKMQRLATVQAWALVALGWIVAVGLITLTGYVFKQFFAR